MIDQTHEALPDGLKTIGGPLSGLRVVEFAGIGPVPFAGMLLSDMGADIVCIERLGVTGDPADIVGRGRNRIAVDLKDAAAVEKVSALCDQADVVLEGFRPGVMERLGLGPEKLCARNSKLVYGRMTGWGQSGPLATAAGHDINYVALSGALAAIGPAEGPPVVPLNLVGDYGGGALYLVVGVLAALLEARQSGRGQIVDAAMCDGAVSLMSIFYSLLAQGKWKAERTSNIIDGAAPFYGTYECADKKYVAVGALEPQFYALLVQGTELEGVDLTQQNNEAAWPALRQRFAAVFKTRTQEDWISIFEGTDACFSPILTLDEAPLHPHLLARKSFINVDGLLQPAPAPRFSRTVSHPQFPANAGYTAMDNQLEKWASDSSKQDMMDRWSISM